MWDLQDTKYDFYPYNLDTWRHALYEMNPVLLNIFPQKKAKRCYQ
jgi:hypothetical protein